MSTDHPFETDFSFSVVATVLSVPIVLSELRAILEFGSSDEESELLIAITEIAHNAVSAQPVGADSPIEITVGGRPPVVSITDHAGGFAEPPNPPMPSTDAASGRGLLLARAFVPGMEIVPTGGTAPRRSFLCALRPCTGPRHRGFDCSTLLL